MYCAHTVKFPVNGNIFRHIVAYRVVAQDKFLGFALGISGVKNKAFPVKKPTALKAEYLKAGFSSVRKACNNILVKHPVGNHLLLVAHLFYGVYLVTDFCRPLKFKAFGSLLHLSGKLLYRACRTAL